jgi:uncharacterized protein YeaO (DUF488 family)
MKDIEIKFGEESLIGQYVEATSKALLKNCRIEKIEKIDVVIGTPQKITIRLHQSDYEKYDELLDPMEFLKKEWKEYENDMRGELRYQNKKSLLKDLTEKLTDKLITSYSKTQDKKDQEDIIDNYLDTINIVYTSDLVDKKDHLSEEAQKKIKNYREELIKNIDKSQIIKIIEKLFKSLNITICQEYFKKLEKHRTKTVTDKMRKNLNEANNNNPPPIPKITNLELYKTTGIQLGII